MEANHLDPVALSDRDGALGAPAPLPHPGILWPAREITARTKGARILFTRDDLDTTYVSGRRGVMVLFLVEDRSAYRVGRYDVTAGEWRTLSPVWPRFGNALAFACSLVS